MNILNLYAGIGGNRAGWSSEHVVTAIENDPAIADVYRSRFPSDMVLVEDAHAFLLAHFSEYDFIWSSPPCQSHGQYRHNVGVRAKGYAPLYPDMALYEEIILLKHHFGGKWIVENTNPYYEPLIAPTAKVGRHLVWANFDIKPIDVARAEIRTKNKISDFDGAELVAASAISNKRQSLRNCVDLQIGAHILACAVSGLE